MKTVCIWALFLTTALCALAQGDLVSVTSPNGQIEFRLFMLPQEDPGEHPRLAYEVSFRGKPLMDTSYLGLNISDQPVLGVNLDIVTSKQTPVDETYTV